MFDVAVFGRSVCDSWQDLPAVEEQPTRCSFGGSGANIAVDLAMLGIRCTLVSALGTDSFSDKYRRYLLQRSVDLSFAQTVDGPLPTCEMWISRKHQYRWRGGYDGLGALEQVPVGRVKDFTGSMFFADFPLYVVNSEQLTDRCYCAPGEAVFASPRGIVNLVKLPWRVVFLNNREAAFVESQLEASLVSLSERIPSRMWIVTNGSAPTTLHMNGGVRSFAVPVAQCVNGTGGGDAFAAGVFSALHRNYDMESAIRIGHAAASIVIREIGCQTPSLTWSAIAERCIAVGDPMTRDLGPHESLA